MKFLDCCRFLDTISGNLAATLKSFSSPVANGVEDELFEMKLANPYEEGQSIEFFYKALNLETEDYFPTSKQLYPDFEN